MLAPLNKITIVSDIKIAPNPVGANHLQNINNTEPVPDSKPTTNLFEDGHRTIK